VALGRRSVEFGSFRRGVSERAKRAGLVLVIEESADGGMVTGRFQVADLAIVLALPAPTTALAFSN